MQSKIDAARKSLANDPHNQILQVQLARLLCDATWQGQSKSSRYYREAAAIYRGLVGKNPHKPAYLVNLGAVLSNHGQHRQALEYYRQAESVGWQDRNLDFNIGVALINLGQFESAQHYMRSASQKRKSPKTIEAYFDAQAH